MMPAPWAAKYIGAEFEDRGRGPRYDCWGLVRAVLAAEFGKLLPSFDDEYRDTTDSGAIARIITAELAHWQRVTERRVGDVVLFRLRGKRLHIGILVSPTAMLHCMRGVNACIERIDTPVWSPVLEGVYRHD